MMLARIIIISVLTAVTLCGCETMPKIKDGELVVDSSTTATIEDVGVARINKRF